MTERFTPLGIKLLRWIYLVNAILFLLSQILFRNRIMIFDKEAIPWLAMCIRAGFLVIPLYLYIRMPRLAKDAWGLGMVFHAFFVLNNGIEVFDYRSFFYSIIRIAGESIALIHSWQEVTIFILNLCINLFILGYLFTRRGYFFLH